jgi:hypothetical protein
MMGWVNQDKPVFQDNTRLQETIEALLNHWGRWAYYGNKINLGYSKKSNIQRIIDNGGILTRMAGFKPTPEDPKAQEMERLILQLMCFDKRGAEAVKTYYAGQRSRPEAAHRLKISITTLNERIRIAKAWLCGRIVSEFGL